MRNLNRSFCLAVIAAGIVVAQPVLANPHGAAGESLSPNFTRGLTFQQTVAREEARRTSYAQAGYQKQTEFDNTPYRFNMKPGEKMSADQFDAWMQSRGIRIVRAKADSSVEPAATAAPATVNQ